MTDYIQIDSDWPIKSESEDEFSRAGFARRIADIIAKREDPASIAIGINAPWGEGKTSVLNMIIERFQETKTLYLEFNPWRYATEDKILKNFFFDLARVIGINLETRAEKTGRAMRTMAKPLATAKIVGLDADEAIVGLSAMFPDAEIDELKIRIERKLEEQNRRVVIIMDDIDRLDNEEIQALFRLVKLSANFPNTAYILSFDEKRVSDAMKEKYGGDIEAGKNFLEKILQVSLALPPPSSAVLINLVERAINNALDRAEIEFTRVQNQRFTELFLKAFRLRIKTPRQIKRLSNALNFALPLMKGEVDSLDLLFIECIKTFYPRLYEAIKENGELILDFAVGDEILGQKSSDFENVISENISKALDDIPSHNKNGIESLIQDLFPGLSRLKTFSGSPRFSGKSDEQNRGISQRNYFWRYFSYGIQPHDVSDNAANKFLENLSDLELQDAAKTLSEFLDDNQARFSVLIGKLRDYEESLGEERSEKLALVISSLSDNLRESHPDDRVYGFGVMSECSRLLVRLTNNVSEPRKSQLLREIVADTPSISFALEFATMIRAFGEQLKTTDDTIAVIAEGVEREVNKIVATRIANFEREGNLSEKHFFYVQDLYFFWFNNDFSSQREYLKSCFESDASCLSKFLAGLFQINLRPDREFSTYIHRTFSPWLIVRSLIDLGLLEKKFLQMFPDLEDNLDTSDPIRRLASNFVKEYKKEISTQPAKI